MIRRVVIVVPVHDEEAVLAECLAAVAASRAALPAGVTSRLVVVLDDCADGSADIARRAIAENAENANHFDEACAVAFRNVGRARAHGVARALAGASAVPDGRLRDVWVATTDADSRVPASWLVDQIALANSGVDAVAGVVEVHDWGAHSLERAKAYRAYYESKIASDGTHDHVHGANLGVRATAYLAAGGFAPLVTGEDHALWNAVRAGGHRSHSTRRIAVRTSARLAGRAPHGFAGFLASFGGGSAGI